MLFNLPKQDKNAKSTAVMFRLYLALLTDVKIEDFPAAADATISETVLKTDAKWTYIDSTTVSINPTTTPGESPINGKQTLTPTIEGVSKKSLQWIYDNVGENVVAVWEDCITKQKFIAGSPCSNGLMLKYTSIGKLDTNVNGIALSLEGEECPEPFWFYEPIGVDEGEDFPIEADPVVTP